MTRRVYTKLMVAVCVSMLLLFVGVVESYGAPHRVDWRSEYETHKESRLQSLRGKAVWTEEDVVEVVRYACYDYEIPGEEWSYLETVVPHLGRRESGLRAKAANPTSSARGILQFLRSWGPESKRLDPVWSVYRIVRVYRDGGEVKIRQHWRATIGGL